MVKHSDKHGCPLPCSRVNYDLDVSYYHENTLGDPDLYKSSNFSLNFFPFSRRVEERIETLVYDAGGLMTAVGGNLGLFLGFSCLSVLFAIVSWIKKKIQISLKCN